MAKLEHVIKVLADNSHFVTVNGGKVYARRLTFMSYF